MPRIAYSVGQHTLQQSLKTTCTHVCVHTHAHTRACRLAGGAPHPHPPPLFCGGKRSPYSSVSSLPRPPSLIFFRFFPSPAPSHSYSSVSSPPHPLTLIFFCFFPFFPQPHQTRPTRRFFSSFKCCRKIACGVGATWCPLKRWAGAQLVQQQQARGVVAIVLNIICFEICAQAQMQAIVLP